ncbi:MAG: BolA/IbaG family iron-sulfur metabolism protein [Gammaproteobacteria bacterium]|jgi:acid stress-induced BolA-like protein IbaG/YrbA|nr:BolA/IbaG family iron-sulfur metabolism protein [Gammaproteobacteria bacterium]
MDVTEVQALLQAHMPECEFHVQSEGGHYHIEAIGDVFDGLRPVKKQQLVYAALGQSIAEGAMHAVNIRTYTRAEWEARASA